MKLIEYMHSKGLKDADFASLMGGKTTPHAVKKWKYEETRPRLEDVARIETLTDGAVRLADFISDREDDEAAA